MNRDQKRYIRDIIEAMDAASCFVENMTFEELEGDLRTQYAIERAFSIIGEAVKKVEDEVRASYPAIPWKNMAGMRDVIVHGYFAVNLEIVWTTIRDRFPKERRLLAQVLEDMESN